MANSAVKAGDTSVTFNVDLNAGGEEWYLASITRLDGSWSVLDYGVYVLKGAVAKAHSVMPVTTASHELTFEGQGRYQQAWVPTNFAPITVPFPAHVSAPSYARYRRPPTAAESAQREYRFGAGRVARRTQRTRG